jgi:hypothetical protein
MVVCVVAALAAAGGLAVAQSGAGARSSVAAAKPPQPQAPASPVLHPTGPRETCPEKTLPLPGDAIAGAVRRALAEAHTLMPDADLRGLRADAATAGGSGHARIKCGKTVAARTVTVKLRLPAYAPSASAQEHTVLVARFARGYRVWYLLR